MDQEVAEGTCPMDVAGMIELLYRSPKHDGVVHVNEFTRDEFVQLCQALGFTAGVEVGVATGRYSEQFCLTIPTVRMYAVDPYIPFESYGPDPVPYNEQYEAARVRLAKLPNCTLLRQTSMDAVRTFADASLDFVYIDGNHHYEYVCDDLREWSKKVRPGGIVSGHDYNYYGTPTARRWGVIKAVDEFAAAHSIRPMVIWGRANRRGFSRCPKSFLWVNP